MFTTKTSTIILSAAKDLTRHTEILSEAKDDKSLPILIGNIHQDGHIDMTYLDGQWSLSLPWWWAGRAPYMASLRWNGSPWDHHSPHVSGGELLFSPTGRTGPFRQLGCSCPALGANSGSLRLPRGCGRGTTYDPHEDKEQYPVDYSSDDEEDQA